MKPKELLDQLCELGVATSEVDELEHGDLTYHLRTKINEADFIVISKELMAFLECDEIRVYLADSGDEDDFDRIAIYYKLKK
jgi:hypothetical protein